MVFPELPLEIYRFVSDYNTFVQLKAAAPELRELWGIAPMPGVKKDDGETVRWAPGAMQSIIMFEFSDHKEEAWEWIKWWTSAEVQARFGNEVEAMFSVAYRWNTANLAAITQIPWTLEELETIKEQWRWLKTFPKYQAATFSSGSCPLLGTAW